MTPVDATSTCSLGKAKLAGHRSCHRSMPACIPAFTIGTIGVTGVHHHGLGVAGSETFAIQHDRCRLYPVLGEYGRNGGRPIGCKQSQIQVAVLV
jgi:hypothetical protein